MIPDERGKYTLKGCKVTPVKRRRCRGNPLNVHVTKVNTLSVKPKSKRLRYQQSGTRQEKAIVTLAEGEQIDFCNSPAE